MISQWNVAAYFLCIEVILLLLISLPFIKPTRWEYLFGLGVVQSTASLLKYSAIVISTYLVIILYESRNSRNASWSSLDDNHTCAYNMQMKSFQAEMNIYISGMALMLIPVLYRVIASMSIIDASNHKSAIKVASASKMRYQDKDEVIKALKEELKTLNKGLEESRKADTEARTRLDAMNAQAEYVSRECDRITREYKSLLTKCLENKKNA